MKTGVERDQFWSSHRSLVTISEMFTPQQGITRVWSARGSRNLWAQPQKQLWSVQGDSPQPSHNHRILTSVGWGIQPLPPASSQNAGQRSWFWWHFPHSFCTMGCVCTDFLYLENWEWLMLLFSINRTGSVWLGTGKKPSSGSSNNARTSKFCGLPGLLPPCSSAHHTSV